MRRGRRAIVSIALAATVVLPVAVSSPSHAATRRCVSLNAALVGRTLCRVTAPVGGPVTLKWNIKGLGWNGAFSVTADGHLVADDRFGDSPVGSLVLPSCTCEAYLETSDDASGPFVTVGLLQMVY